MKYFYLIILIVFLNGSSANAGGCCCSYALKSTSNRILMGDSVTLTAFLTGGANYSFQWSATPSVSPAPAPSSSQTSTTQYARVSPSITTIYTVTMTNATGAIVTASTIVTVKNFEVQIDGPVAQNFCPSNQTAQQISTKMLGNGTPPYTYQWHSDPATSMLTPNDKDLNFYPTTSATYTLIATDSKGEQDTTYEYVNVPKTPVILFNQEKTYSPSFVLCEGKSANLSAMVGSPNSKYLWNGGETTKEISVSKSGSYGVIVTDQVSSCQMQADPVSVIFHEAEIPNISYDPSLQLLTSSYSGYNQWYMNNVLIPGANDIKYKPTQSGEYKDKITDDIGCSNFSEAINISIHIQSTGISPNSCIGENLIPCPNPFNERTVFNAGSLTNYSVVISDLTGKVIKILIDNSVLTREDIPTDGMYLYTVIQKGIIISRGKLLME